MIYKYELKGLTQNFRYEHRDLVSAGFTSWLKVKELKDQDINNLVIASKSSSITNLKKIRTMAIFVCDLGLKPNEAALLMHAGIPSVSALASTTPQSLIKNTGLLLRTLKS